MSAPAVAGVLLTHGAGSDREHHTLLALEAGLGVPVRRIDFPYRQRGGRRPPDRAPVLIEAVRAAAAAFAEELGVDPARLVLGGRSMGGRMCSLAVAEGWPAAGLALLSYPLHPPGKPERLRTEHFPNLAVPCLFLGGDRDPFGTPEELTAVAEAIAGPVTFEWVAGGRHDMKANDAEIVAGVASWLSALA